MTRFCIGCKNDWCLSADGTSHDTGSSIVGCTAWPHDEAPECPCDGRACDDLPGGPLPGCPYRVATNGLTHFVPRTEENADAAVPTPKALVLEDRDGEATPRIAALGKDCRPDVWRWRTLPQWIRHPDEAGWNYTDTEPKASDFMNPHHHEIEALVVVGSLSHLRTEPAQSKEHQP